MLNPAIDIQSREEQGYSLARKSMHDGCHLRFSTLLSLFVILLPACSDKGPDFDRLQLRMQKSEVLEILGEPDRTQYLVASENGENTLVDIVPENTEAVLEHWTYTGNRIFRVTDDRQYVRSGRTTVIFRPQGGESLYGGSWFREAGYYTDQAR